MIRGISVQMSKNRKRSVLTKDKKVKRLEFKILKEKQSPEFNWQKFKRSQYSKVT